MKSYKNKSITRFNFEVSRNTVSKKAGSNTVTISTKPSDGQQYSTGTTSLVMTVKEAKVLQSFLNQNLVSGDTTDTETTSVTV